MANLRQSKNYFPQPKFQFKFLRFLLIGASLQMSATCAILYYFLRDNYEILVTYAGLDVEITDILFRELRVLIALIGTTFFGYLIALTVLGVMFSHRVAGVIFALQRSIKDINEGKNVRLKLRRSDEFQELTESFNEMAEKLQTLREDALKAG